MWQTYSFWTRSRSQARHPVAGLVDILKAKFFFISTTPSPVCMLLRGLENLGTSGTMCGSFSSAGFHATVSFPHPCEVYPMSLHISRIYLLLRPHRLTQMSHGLLGFWNFAAQFSRWSSSPAKSSNRKSPVLSFYRILKYLMMTFQETMTDM